MQKLLSKAPISTIPISSFKNQQFLERTIYRSENLKKLNFQDLLKKFYSYALNSKKIVKELGRVQAQIFPEHTPKIKALIGGVAAISFPDKALSRARLLKQVKGQQRQQLIAKADAGRAFGTASKNKYIMTHTNPNSLWPMTCVRSKRMTILKRD